MKSNQEIINEMEVTLKDLSKKIHNAKDFKELALLSVQVELLNKLLTFAREGV